jgi:hypothetical protein
VIIIFESFHEFVQLGWCVTSTKGKEAAKRAIEGLIENSVWDDTVEARWMKAMPLAFEAALPYPKAAPAAASARSKRVLPLARRSTEAEEQEDDQAFGGEEGEEEPPRAWVALGTWR